MLCQYWLQTLFPGAQLLSLHSGASFPPVLSLCSIASTIALLRNHSTAHIWQLFILCSGAQVLSLLHQHSRQDIQHLLNLYCLEKGMATHSSILAWRIPWTKEAYGLAFMWLQRVRHDWAIEHNLHYRPIRCHYSGHILENAWYK